MDVGDTGKFVQHRFSSRSETANYDRMSRDAAAVDDDILQKARNLLELATLLDIQWHGALGDFMRRTHSYRALEEIQAEYDLVAFSLIGLSLPIPIADYVLAARTGQTLFRAWLGEVTSLSTVGISPEEAIEATISGSTRRRADAEQLRALDLLMKCWEQLDRLQFGYDPDDLEAACPLLIRKGDVLLRMCGRALDQEERIYHAVERWVQGRYCLARHFECPVKPKDEQRLTRLVQLRLQEEDRIASMPDYPRSGMGLGWEYMNMRSTRGALFRDLVINPVIGQIESVELEERNIQGRMNHVSRAELIANLAFLMKRVVKIDSVFDTLPETSPRAVAFRSAVLQYIAVQKRIWQRIVRDLELGSRRYVASSQYDQDEQARKNSLRLVYETKHAWHVPEEFYRA